jgi:hypothetical protein
MAKPKLSENIWADIRTLWLTTDRKVRDIAREFGVSDTAINKRAAKEVWGPRNAPARKRALVASASAGLNFGLQTKPSDVSGEQAIIDAANQDAQDMSLAASVGRRILQRCQWLLDLVKPDKDDAPTDEPALDDPKDLKSTADAARAAMEMIRRARNLDEPAPPTVEASPLDALAASLEQARKEKL